MSLALGPHVPSVNLTENKYITPQDKEQENCTSLHAGRDDLRDFRGVFVLSTTRGNACLQYQPCLHCPNFVVF